MAALIAAAAAVAWRFLTFTGFNNDHYVHVARAYQIVRGDWPVRDFVDPGMPLMYLVSAASRAVIGAVPLAEWVVVAAAMGIAAACTLATAARLSRSIAVAFGVTALIIMINTRTFGYPKILLYAAAALLIVRTARTPTAARVFALACMTAVAFLFRHDHGLFIGLPALVAVAGSSVQQGREIVIRRSAALIVWTALLLIPWAIFVQVHGGLVAYFTAGLTFWQAEASEMTLATLPVVDWSAVDTKGNALAWLFFLFHLLPCVAIVLAGRRAANGVTRWRGETAAVAALAVMAVLVNVFFMRESLAARIPDAIVPAALLGAWMMGLAGTADAAGAKMSSALIFRRAAAVILFVVSAGAVVRAADVGDQLDRAQVIDSAAAVQRRAGDVWEDLRRIPDRDNAPSRYAGALVPFIEYVRRCTFPDDRLMMTGLFPEVYVMADRGFAGGHIAFMAPFYTGDADQRMTVARLQRESVPFVLIVEDVPLEMPRLVAYIESAYSPLTHIDVPDTRGVRVLVDRRHATGPRDPETGWPCSVRA